MAKLAFITLSNQGAKVLNQLMEKFPAGDGFVSEKVEVKTSAKRYKKMLELTGEIFNSYDGLVYIAPCGAVVRAVSQYIADKKTDPAVVVLDVGARYAVSLLSGHEGGANDLTMKIANATGAEPVITTTSEAGRNVIVGIGCRRGKSADDIIDSVKKSLAQAGQALENVRLLASADVKANEEGLLITAEKLGIPIRFIASEEIRSSNREFEHSDYVQKSVNLPAVAEPSALLAGRRTKLILRKKKFNGITVAIAKENCSSLE